MPDFWTHPSGSQVSFMCTYGFMWELEGSLESPKRCLHPSFAAQGRHSASGAEDIALTPPYLVASKEGFSSRNVILAPLKHPTLFL